MISLSAYVVILDDGNLYTSSSVHPLPSSPPDKPRYKHSRKTPLGSIRALLVPDGGESIRDFQGQVQGDSRKASMVGETDPWSC